MIGIGIQITWLTIVIIAGIGCLSVMLTKVIAKLEEIKIEIRVHR